MIFVLLFVRKSNPFLSLSMDNKSTNIIRRVLSFNLTLETVLWENMRITLAFVKAALCVAITCIGFLVVLLVLLTPVKQFRDDDSGDAAGVADPEGHMVIDGSHEFEAKPLESR